MAGENRSEQATPRRKQKAREEGRVARSPEPGAALGICAAVWILSWQFASGIGAWRGVWHWALTNAANEEVRPVWGLLLTAQVALHWLFPVLAGSFAISLLAMVAQGGMVFAPAMLQPKVERLSPAAKLQQLFSLTGLTSLGKSLLPTAAMSYLVISIFIREWLVICFSAGTPAVALARRLSACLLEAAWKCGLVLLVWAVIDFFVKRQKFAGDLRMTKQELREEMKESEGNPQIKARIRKLQRQVRRKRMLDDVAKAAVIITNPTEYAIALEYNDRLFAPVVVAKGRSLLAQQIKQAALWNGVPAVENVPLAHALYRTADVGQAIPAKLYAAVAEVLAFVFRAQARVAGGQR